MDKLEFQTILLSEKEGVASLVMNRPQALNAISLQVAREIIAACTQIQANPDNRVVVFSGAGRYFSCGGDLNDVAAVLPKSPETQDRQMKIWCDMIRTIAELQLPTIAAINGPALGGGCGLALACDMRIAAEDASIGAIFVTMGAPATDTGVTWLLPRLIGAARAIEMMITGDVIDAKEAERIALYNRVVARDKLDEAVAALAKKIAAAPSFALRLTKKAIYRSVWQGLSEHLDYEAGTQVMNFQTAEFKERIATFTAERERRAGAATPRCSEANK